MSCIFAFTYKFILILVYFDTNALRVVLFYFYLTIYVNIVWKILHLHRNLYRLTGARTKNLATACLAVCVFELDKFKKFASARHYSLIIR
jgi:hypothetical protein